MDCGPYAYRVRHVRRRDRGGAHALSGAGNRIYPGDLIKEEMIIDRAFAPNMPGAAAFVSERPMAVGRIARRTLLPGQLIPINALEEQKIVTRGNVVKVVVEDGDLSIITYGSSLQSGSAGALIQLRNLDTGVIIRGIIQPDGSVRIQNG